MSTFRRFGYFVRAGIIPITFCENRLQRHVKRAHEAAKFMFAFRLLRDRHFYVEISTKLSFYEFMNIWRRKKDPRLMQSEEKETQ